MINIKNNSIYNPELKEQFLNTINEKTRQSYRRIFTITFKHELMLNKDINQFSLKEIEKVLWSFKSRTRNTIESYGRIISSYLNWCVKIGLISKNVMEDMKPDDFEKFIHDEPSYISEEQLRKIEDMCNNYQDAAILRLLFIGVGGKRLSEIRNLKVSDVDFENKRLRLIDVLKEDEKGAPLKYTERFIDVDERTLSLIKGASNQKIYLKRNGEITPTEHNNIRPFTDLVQNDYVIRPSITKTDNYYAPVDKFVIYRRLNMIKDTLGLDRFNAKFIQQSGMLYFANKIVEGDKVSLIDLKIVADQFNIKSYHNLKGIVTMDNIRKIYTRSWFYMARTFTLHEKDIVLNKGKLKNILDSKGLSYIDFYEKVVDAYGLDISYKGFMSLLSNRSTWKLLYAWAIVDVLGITIKDIFEIVDVDVNKLVKEKEEWKRKYQKSK